MVDGVGCKPLWPKGLLLFCGVFIALWSLGVFAGLYTESRALALFVSWSSPVTMYTASALSMSGIGLIAVALGWHRLARGLGAVIISLAVASILQGYSGGSVGSNAAATPTGSDVGLAPTVSMAINCAVCFVLVGISLLSVKNKDTPGGASPILAIFSSFVVAFSLLVLIGYLSEIEAAYVWSGEAGMSAASAIAFLLIGLSLLLYDRFVVQGPSDRFLWLFLPMAISVLTITFGFATALWIEQKKTVYAAEQAEGFRIRERVLRDTKRGVDGLEHMVKIWIFNKGTPRQLWEDEGKLVISQVRGLEEILWVDKDGKPAWTVGNQNWLKLDVLLNEKIMAAAKADRSYTISGIYDDNGGLVGISLYLPIYIGEAFDGYIVGVFDIKEFIQGALARETAAAGNFHIAIVHSGNEIININGFLLVNNPSSVRVPLNLHGLNLDISIKALDGVLGKREPFLPVIIILSGLLAVVLVSLLIRYALAANRRAEEREKAIAMLRQANDTIAEQDKLVSLGTLTAGIAHEVKNPLNIIKSFSELSLALVEDLDQTLQSDAAGLKAEDREKINETLATLRVNLVRICEQSKRSNNTIQRMLAHTRGSQAATLTDVHSLLDEYLNLSYYGVRAQDPTFSVKITKRYDLSAPKINIVAEDMSRVFLNLFNNAYYALAQKKKGAPKNFVPELIISTLSISGRFEIRIRDNGCGIPEADKDRVFTPFFTTKPVGIGTGLGLSLSHSIVGEHGGTLDFVSKEGEFTEFHITLPVKTAVPSEAPTEFAVRF